MTDKLAEIKRRHKRVAWGCEQCAEYCDVLPVVDELKRLLQEVKRLQALEKAVGESWNQTRQTFSAGFEAGRGYPNAEVVPDDRYER